DDLFSGHGVPDGRKPRGAPDLDVAADLLLGLLQALLDQVPESLHPPGEGLQPADLGSAAGPCRRFGRLEYAAAPLGKAFRVVRGPGTRLLILGDGAPTVCWEEEVVDGAGGDGAAAERALVGCGAQPGAFLAERLDRVGAAAGANERVASAQVQA